MKRFSVSKLVFLSASVILLSCNGSEKDQSKNSLKSADPLTDHIDSSINAADDFFTFANGEWLKQNPIPDAEPSNGIFLIIQDSVNAAVRQICELSANKTNVSKGSNQQKIGDLFYSGMDTLSIDKQGIQPINAYLKAIDQIKSLEDVLNQTAVLHQIGAPAFFNFDLRQDEKKSEQMLVAFTQGGLGLPERDYYTNTDQRNEQIREEYKLFIQKIFSLSGNNEQKAMNNAETIIRIETALAKESRKMEALRDPYKNYNKIYGT
jgi:putative endopeptidase